MKKHIKNKIASAALAAAIVFSGAMPAAYAEPVTRPNKIPSNSLIAQTIAEEGAVLLKNDYNALPLKKNDTVIGFGSAQESTQIYGGGGSGWVNAIDVTSYRAGMETAANQGLIRAYVGSDRVTTDGAFSKILYFVGRSTTEGEDLKESQYYLDENVRSDISTLITAYGKERVIVVLNVGTVCDTSWLIEQDVAGIIVVYYGGEQSGTALANVLTGVANPSGKTVDTWAKSYNDYPSSDGSGIGTFAGDRATYYTEDVYVGYRYFSTFDPDYERVNYEFGYGLSYTKFRMDNYSCTFKDGIFSVTADITNIGAYAGKEVVQVYIEAPKGLLGAPTAELAGFAKTDILQPGQTQTLNVTFTENDLARYDDTGKINLNSWVVEKGDYKIRVGNSVKNAYSNASAFTYSVAENKTTLKTGALRNTKLDKRLLSDGSYEQLGDTETRGTAVVPACGSIVIQAEDYSEAVGKATSELYTAGTVNGFGLGNLNLIGTSLTYLLKVEKAGTYRMAFNFSSAWDGQTDMFRLYVNDVAQDNVKVNMDKTHTDSDGLWHTYRHLRSDDWTVNLPAGEIELKFVGNDLKFMNFDSFIIYSDAVSATRETTVQAETFTASSLGITVMPDGATTQTSDNGANYFEYALNVETAGKYYLSLKASNVTRASENAFMVLVNGKTTDAKIALPRTAANGDVLESNYITFIDTAPVAIDLPQGAVRLRLITRDSALCRMDSFKLIPEAMFSPTDAEFNDNTNDFGYITDIGGKPLEKVITYDDVYADHNKMDDFVAQMSVPELARLLGLDLDQNDAQTGTGGVGGKAVDPAYKLPFANTSDGPAGIRYINNNLYSTWFPCMTMLASTWNTDLAYAFGEGIATEAMLGGVNVWLAPGVNIHRNPLCGRNFEYFSEDPFIAGIFGTEITKASQSYGVSVCVKHFAANNQETNRFGNDSRVSARALREIYLKPFETIVKNGKPLSIMSSYNMINGLHAASSYDIITQTLRDEWGFDGVVFSDWSASMSHISLVQSGNTYKSANPQYDELVKAYRSGVLSREDLERNAKDAVMFLIRSNTDNQKISILSDSELNNLSDANITKVVAVDDDVVAFVRFCVKTAGYYKFDQISVNGTVKVHNGDFNVNSLDPVYLDYGIYELAITLDDGCDSLGALYVQKTAAPVVDPDPPSPGPDPENPSESNPSDSGLSGGAIAGITVAAAAVAAGGAAGTVIAVKNRKRKNTGTQEKQETEGKPE